MPADTLRAKAQEALAERHYYSPAGSSAIDHYLALRQLSPGDAGVDGALTQLQPYLLIAGEQALVRGDLAEARRLLALLGRVDPAAPALPRLRDGLRAMELARVESESVDAVATADSVAVAADAPAHGAALDAAKAVKNITMTEAPAAPHPLPSAPLPVHNPPTTPAPVASAPAASPTSLPSPARAAPRLLSDAAPRYPPTALKRRIEGYVQVAFTIQPDGRIAGVRVVASTPAEIFDAAALAAVAHWRFEATGQSFATQRTLDFRLPRG